jgi:site-specific DNA recombinase
MTTATARQPQRPAPPQDDRHRAVLYLRVSSRDQLETDYDDDGLSISGQRVRCEQKAAEYGAEIIDTYVERAESAKTNERPELQRMLARIRAQRDVDYVIVWKVDRLARNRRDDANMVFEIEMTGASLISATENIDQTPAGRLMHGMLASFAEYYSRNLANEVLKGATEKARRGGTPGLAPLGYCNIREIVDGREIRTVALDPERAPLVRWAFETYATGMYSMSDLAALLEARGLRNRPSRRYGSRPLSVSALHKILMNPYYTGVVRYRGNSYKGRHDVLISEELFEQVKAVLATHRLSGERDRKHGHYLKGSIFCGMCGARLTYSRNRGNGGMYEYFVCGNNQRHRCVQPAQRVDAVEAAIERHYATVRLNRTERQRVQRGLERHLAKLATASDQEIARCHSVLAELKEQERKLLHKHYADNISDELFAEEQGRIRRERAASETILMRLTIDHDELQAALALALQLADRDLQDLYLRATPHIRRLMNQALFEAIWIAHDDVAGSQLASPFYELHALGRTSPKATPTPCPAALALAPAGSLETAKAPAGAEALDRGSIRTKMVALRGLEPRTNGL